MTLPSLRLEKLLLLGHRRRRRLVPVDRPRRRYSEAIIIQPSALAPALLTTPTSGRARLFTYLVNYQLISLHFVSCTSFFSRSSVPDRNLVEILFAGATKSGIIIPTSLVQIFVEGTYLLT